MIHQISAARRRRLEDAEEREQLRRLLRKAREGRGWSQEKLAEEASSRIPEEAELEVTRHHVARLETKSSHPLGTPEKKLRLRAVVEALGLEKTQVNRLAGGI